MTQDIALQLQDYFQTINRTLTHPKYIYWFEEIETDETDHQGALKYYYEQNSEQDYMSRMKDFMLQIEEVDDWEEVVLDILEEFGLLAKQREILEMMTRLCQKDCETWQITPKLHTNHNVETDDAFEDSDDIDETASWKNILIKVPNGYFMLHVGVR